MAIEYMHPAHYAHTSSIGKTRGPLGVTPDTFSLKRHSLECAISKPVIPKEHRAVRRPHFEKGFDYVLGLGVIVVVFSQSKLSVGSKEEQALYSFNFLDSEVIGAGFATAKTEERMCLPRQGSAARRTPKRTTVSDECADVSGAATFTIRPLRAV